MWLHKFVSMNPTGRLGRAFFSEANLQYLFKSLHEQTNRIFCMTDQLFLDVVETLVLFPNDDPCYLSNLNNYVFKSLICYEHSAAAREQQYRAYFIDKTSDKYWNEPLRIRDKNHELSTSSYTLSAPDARYEEFLKNC